MGQHKVKGQVFSLLHVLRTKGCIRICIVLLLLLDYFSLISAYFTGMKREHSPKEKLVFTLPTDENGGPAFDVRLKYPPYRQCEIPKKILRKKNITSKTYGRGDWWMYWSNTIWGRYFFEFAVEIEEWERTMEKFIKANPFFESGLPSLLIIAWSALIVIVDLFAYPLISMFLFRGLILLWNILSHKVIRMIFRKLIIWKEKFQRRHILRVYQDAGHRPPFYRYSLPLFFRKDEYEVVPKELNESDEEFWSTDDEGQTPTNNRAQSSTAAVDTTNKAKAPPEFVPEYEITLQDEYTMSEAMKSYMVNASKHGMYAVWTVGVDNIDLEELSEIISSKQDRSKVPHRIRSHKSQKSKTHPAPSTIPERPAWRN